MRDYAYEMDKPYGLWEMDQLREITAMRQLIEERPALSRKRHNRGSHKQSMSNEEDDYEHLEEGFISQDAEKAFSPLRRDGSWDTYGFVRLPRHDTQDVPLHELLRPFAPVSLKDVRRKATDPDAQKSQNDDNAGTSLVWSHLDGSSQVVEEELSGLLIQDSGLSAWTPDQPFGANPCFMIRNTTGVFFSRWVQYSDDHYYCNGTEISKERYEREKQWNTNCTETHRTVSGCFCAQDRSSSKCNQVFKMQCNSDLLTPQDCLIPKGIQPEEAVVGGVPITSSGLNCLRYKQSETIQLDFRMRCSASYSKVAASKFPLNVPLKDRDTGEIFPNWAAVMGNFSYFAHDGNQVDGVYEFAMSEPVTTPIYLSPWNFFHFVDVSGRQEQTLLSPGHYLGKDTISFHVDISKLHEEYFSGNRVFFELGYSTKHAVVNPSILRLYLDFPERTDPSYNNLSEILWATLLPLGILLVLAAVGIYLLYKLIKKRRRKQFFKMKDDEEEIDYVAKVAQ